MQKSLLETAVSSSGFLLLDSSMKPIFMNPAAAQILMYPDRVEIRDDLREYLASKLEPMLFSGQRVYMPTIVTKFQSGKRSYLCRCFRVNTPNHANSQPSLAVLFERAPERSVALNQLSEKFHLTGREQEVSQYLLQGLSSKEIAVRMEISPNTVKAFLRLIMVKMGVSTRSGIVAKAYCS
jgi:DNA-binding CsgD family transcriptional regulator